MEINKTAERNRGGFFEGISIGYALKKVVKVVAVIDGLFFAGMAYLQYQQLVNINWNKLQAVSQTTVTTLKCNNSYSRF